MSERTSVDVSQLDDRFEGTVYPSIIEKDGVLSLHLSDYELSKIKRVK